MNEITFFILVLSTCTFAFLSVISRDIFHCAVWLSLTLLCVAGVYFFLSAEFLGVIQVLVYVGGIITLFIFAIKLTAHIGDDSIKQNNKQLVPSLIACGLLFYFLFKICLSNPWAMIQPDAPVFTLKDLGYSLMTVYVLPFEFISLLLLSVMVGAIVIGRVAKK